MCRQNVWTSDKHTREIFVFPVRYVLMRSGVAIFLGQTEVDDVNEVALFAKPHEEIVGLDIAVNEVFRVYVLDSTDHLIRQQQHRLQGKLS